MPKPRRSSAREAREQFDAYVSQYHAIFSRSDQREWFRIYMWGLLTTPQRKNVESIAAVSGRDQSGANLGQALQHFITDSPWDAGRVFARYREIVQAPHRSRANVWVVSDCALLKKGRNSVGTQRQFARSVGKKVNCQLAVMVGMDCPTGFLPLATQLYLPAFWLREFPTLASRAVPDDHRIHRPKAEIARQLLNELVMEGWSADAAVLDDGYRSAAELTDALSSWQIPVSDAEPARVAAQVRFEWLKSRLGFDHFEGRTWVGWHHHMAIVFAAAGFLFTTGFDS